MTTNFCHPEWSPFWNGEFRTVLHVCSQGHGLLVAVELFHICVPGRWWLSEKQKTTRTTKKNDSSSNDNNNDSKFQQLQQHVPFFLVDAGIEKRCHWLNPKMGSDTPRWRVLVCGFGHVFEEVTSLYPKPLTTLWCHEFVSLFTHERHAVFANHELAKASGEAISDMLMCSFWWFRLVMSHMFWNSTRSTRVFEKNFPDSPAAGHHHQSRKYYL